MSAIPTEALSQHIAIVGKTGSGKSYTARGIVESLLDRKQRVCVIDPTGVWYGLRSSADGQHAGYPVVILGGEHRDAPISETSGNAVAELIATRNLPLVIDLSDMLIGARQRFVTEFAEAIHRLNRAPLHLIIDEADEFAPQNPLPESKRMLHQVDRIVRRGRVRGFRVMMITQRPAVLHKNVLTQANTLIAMRLTAPQDRKAIEAWISGQADDAEGREVLQSLARLQRGEGWVWAPEQGVLQRVAFPRIKTFDSGRTPDGDEAITEPATLAQVDLSIIRQSLAEAEEQSKANDPRELRRRIADLEQQLKRQPAPSPAAPIVQRVEVQVVPAEITAAGRELNAAITDALNNVTALQNRLQASIERFNQALSEATAKQAVVHVPAVDSSRRVDPALADLRARNYLRVNAPRQPASAGGVGLPKAERAILTALAQYPAGRSKRQIAILTGYAINGGGFNNAVSALTSKGYIERAGDQLVATDAGLDALGNWTPLPSGAALLAHWLNQLGKAERAILEVLAGAWPKSRTKTELAFATNYSADGGGFNNALSRLRTLELITGRNELRASEELFD
jgi:hypothetical protein